MFVRSKILDPPDVFQFPHQPYDIQNDFMRNLYSVIEKGKIGIFESPTGTGKTLTLLCSTLKWLCDHESSFRKELMEEINDLEANVSESEKANARITDWLDVQFELIKKKERLADLKRQLKQLNDDDTRITEMKKAVKNDRNQTKVHRKKLAKKENLTENKETENVIDEELEDAEFFIDDEDAEKNEYKSVKISQGTSNRVKIFFCSRTHSQLSQVVNEIKNTVYARDIRVVSLASRQQYCINPNVRNLKSNALINERCLDLKKGKSSLKCCQQETQQDANGRTAKKSKVLRSTERKCAFNVQTAITKLSEIVVGSEAVVDIEELIRVARDEEGCPYYASRKAAQDAQIVMLPYQMLLHKKTREQMNLNLKNSIVIIDEAHNLLDTIANIYSAEIKLSQIQQCQRQLTAYKTQYLIRFNSKNLLRLNQLISIANRLTKLFPIGTSNAEVQPTSRMIQVHELFDYTNISPSNLTEIMQFCENTRLAQKVHGYTKRYGSGEVTAAPTKPKETTVSYLKRLSEQISNGKTGKAQVRTPEVVPVQSKSMSNPHANESSGSLRALLTFLECLLEESTDGRVLMSHNSSGQSTNSFLKYLLLNPSNHFSDVVQQCRAVVVAGGTMQPTSEFTEQLFQSQKERIEQHFFDHVVTADAVLPIVVTKGPRNSSFLFNFNNRTNKDLLTDLAMTFQNVCNVVPGGIVCFFGSYDYMDMFYKHFEESGTLSRIRKRKEVFKEPRSGGQLTEQMLLDYARAIKRGTVNQKGECTTGAFLFSVIGGKLSEGLNFSDDLGRCICVVGLPYPNKNSPELMERMKYLDSVGASSSEYYENLCMKAVNQSIGRAIRHIRDYAAVLLIDDRYQQKRIQNKLPSWIQRSLKVHGQYGSVQGALAKFFKERKTCN